MKFGVVIFPGSNCDKDLISVLESLSAGPVVSLWHKDSELQGCTHIFLPGGFSYGDYLRSGAIANTSPVMQSIAVHAANGGFVMGICNGFQILCESGLLPGALARNTNLQFVCKNVFLKPESTNTAITCTLLSDKALKIPIAHGEGRFVCDENTLQSIEKNGQIVFRYCNENGIVNESSNPNGSFLNIAGICNATKNVFGMMPHPERAASDDLFNRDGLQIFESIMRFSGAKALV